VAARLCTADVAVDAPAVAEEVLVHDQTR
jgi:hypothetical protein